MEKLSVEVRESLQAVLWTPQRYSDLRRLGLLDHDVRRLLRNDTLQRFHHHYISGTLDVQLATARCVQAAYAHSVISHVTAAQLRDLRVWSDGHPPPPARTWLTYPPGKCRRNRNKTDLVLRRATLRPGDLQRHLGLVLTSDARTTIDLARELPFAEAVVTADHALAVAVTPEQLEDVVRRQRRWPGIAGARSVLAFADPRSESPLESFARVVFAEAGLPAPVLQVQFWEGSWWMDERVDFWWPEYRTIGEGDGLGKFEAATAAERRRLLRRHQHRDHRLADLDVEVVHFGWEDVGRPAELADRFRAAFSRGLRRTGDSPVWRTPDLADYPFRPHPGHDAFT
ncbi:hypothetical protein [Kribbella sp. NPDC006257]|uniref:hypothetical protein n=1 Tax=Kribbella sp. NPDC006257 TaxID=3156738 RepID=UPI00339FD1EC